MCEESVPKSSELACLAVERLEPGSPADAVTGPARQTGCDLTLNSVKGYKIGCLDIQKGNPKLHPTGFRQWTGRD